MYFRLPAEQRTMFELRSHQGRHQKMEADEASRKDGRCTTSDPAPEKLAKKNTIERRSLGHSCTASSLVAVLGPLTTSSTA